MKTEQELLELANRILTEVQNADTALAFGEDSGLEKHWSENMRAAVDGAMEAVTTLRDALKG